MMHRRIVKYISQKKMIVSLILLMFIIIAIVNSIPEIPPQSLTIGSMIRLEVRIRSYYESSGVLPTSLRELPDDLPVYGDSNLDGWGNGIIYKKVSGNEFALSSYGADNKEDGTDENSDIKVIIDIRKKLTSSPLLQQELK